MTPTMTLHADTALLPDGWRSDVRIGISGTRISMVETGVAAQVGDLQARAVVPGMPNVHSHAFQRVMAGRTEIRGTSADSFWSWRNLMYRTALTLSPADVEAIAAQAYVEMLEGGFTRVGEFHYLHHDRDGQPYDNIAEMAERIAAASATAGIGLTLLPVFYAHAGFGGVPPSDGQRRFINTIDQYQRLFEATGRAVAQLPGGVIGVAPHSLRAVTPDELGAVVALAGTSPIHIHIAEQTQEVADCQAWSGCTPVAWLLDAQAVGQNWCLIHATHMTERETAGLAASGAVAGLCPTTEANLGDGVFRARDFIAGGGYFGVGSDQNVELSVTAELRLLEYGQRLAHRARNVVALGTPSTGRWMIEGALSGGARALGAAGPALAAGAPADLVSLTPRSDHWPLPPGDALLDGWIFSHLAMVDDVYVGGRQVVSGGQHIDRESVARRYGDVLRRLQQAS